MASWSATRGAPTAPGSTANGARRGVSVTVAEGVSRTLDDPGPSAGLAALDFPGFLVRSEPGTGRLHRKCGRTPFWPKPTEGVLRPFEPSAGNPRGNRKKA